ncbi:MAG: hypothetical protein ABI120_05570 [Gemmatimonadaceae bacterium]
MPDRTTLTRARAMAGAALLCFVALNLALYPLNSYFERQRRNNLMQSERALSGSQEIPRYDWSVGGEQQKYWAYMPDARQQPLVVLDGMSQIYAINEEQPGDRITSEILDDSLQGSGTRVFSIAAPNLNHEELLFHLHALTRDSATTPRLLVFGVCFDKMRNMEVRETMRDVLAEVPALDSAWRHSGDSLQAEFPELAKQMMRTLEGARSRQTLRFDQRVEQSLVNNVSEILPVVAIRSDLRTFLYERAYLLRNWMFGIKTSTKRPILADRYTLNQQALVAAVRYAKQHGMRVLLYVIPLNRSAETPYITEQYNGFKSWLQETAITERAAFADLDTAVPDASWGLLYGQPDFKHFKEAGHVATAKALLPLIRAQLTDSLAR